jgi:WD40-like Beta Propeller Repeat
LVAARQRWHVSVRWRDWRRQYLIARRGCIDGPERQFLFYLDAFLRADLFDHLSPAFADGTVSGASQVPGVSKDEPGWVNFDAEIRADGNNLYFVDSYFGLAGEPQNASIVIARRSGNGFVRTPDRDVILREINTSALNYAPDTSADQLEIFFTRLDPAGPANYRASRATASSPFETPQKIAAITGFAEAPSISPDGRSLYYHHRDGAVFHIYRVTRPTMVQLRLPTLAIP